MAMMTIKNTHNIAIYLVVALFDVRQGPVAIQLGVEGLQRGVECQTVGVGLYNGG